MFDIVIPWEHILRLVIAIIIGGLVGIEREAYHKPAGVRTHMLVCLGATLFTIVSIVISPQGEFIRIAAGIVTGIGFLGAGTIFKTKDTIKGLTTAASLWAVAGIGLAIGAGLYVITVAAAILVILVLQLDRIF
jgi:putative Mg2+ transporter-C (MgtC) family protein